MEKNIPLHVAIHAYERVKPLFTGEVKAEGLDLNMDDIPVFDIFWRMLEHREFDACEMSMSYYLVSRDRGMEDITAIPVFTSRVFRHSCIYINRNAGINRPEDLKGKRIGIPEYTMTANLWIRGFLQHEYGVRPQDVIFYRGGEKTQKDKGEKMPLHLYRDDIDIRVIREDQTLDQMLEDGEIDALCSTRIPDGIRSGSSKIKRLFDDSVETERAYFHKTGFFPIMHTFVVRTDLLKQQPWIAANLYRAFVEAKQLSMDRLEEPGWPAVSYPWYGADMEEASQVMGEDIWKYGLEENRHILETMVQYSYEQGLIRQPISIDDLFVGGV